MKVRYKRAKGIESDWKKIELTEQNENKLLKVVKVTLKKKSTQMYTMKSWIKNGKICCAYE